MSDATFRVQSPAEAFHEFTESEIRRLRETDAQFDEEFFRRAQTLVAGRLLVAHAEMESESGEGTA